MSIRIHQLSKQVGMENKALLELLRSRGFEVKSASSTIDNISAESLVEELSSVQPLRDVPIKEAFVASAAAETPNVQLPRDAPVQAAPAAVETPKAPVLPEGAIIKTVEDIKREREVATAAKSASVKAPEPTSAPVAPKSTPMSKAPPSAPQPKERRAAPPNGNKTEMRVINHQPTASKSGKTHLENS